VAKRVRLYEGQKSYIIEVGGVRRELPLIQVDKGLWIASNASIILGDVEFISNAAEIMAEKIKPFNPELLITPEAKAIAFSYEVAKQLTHRRLIIARKSIKAYMADYLVEEVKSITTREKQLLVLVREDAELLAGRRVCILDDVVSTGGTLKALENLVKRAGASVVCRAAIWVEGPWYEGDLVYLDELPIFVDQRRLSELEKAV